MSEQTVRIGFVGVGSMGQCAHLKNYVTLEDCEVVALAEIREALGHRVAAPWDWRSQCGRGARRACSNACWIAASR